MDTFALLTIPYIVQPFLSCFFTHSSHGWGTNLRMAISRLGVDILKHYLAYARDGRLEFGVPSGREPDSDFEPTFKESG